MVSKSAVIGIDLGSSESYVAYVGKGVVDVVQNEVSKRATPTLVGFTDRERLLGDAALAQIRSNARSSCRSFKHLLGRRFDAPDLEKEHFWSTSKLVPTDDGFSGYEVTYKGETREFTATQVTAMYLTKLRELTEKWCGAKVADAVIAVPAYFSDVQRQALLDAAHIAGLPVLRLMNEHTATALAYGIYRSNDFDPEKPLTVAFCSVGHSIFSVAIVQFVRGRLTVLCERSDRVGGRDMDECLMREFAAQFKQRTGADPLANKKSAFKLEDAVLKTKKVLSANSEAPCTVECLVEDQDFASHITRADFERMCAPLVERARAVLEAAKAAAGLTAEAAEQVDAVELVGGSSRVPWVKQVCSQAFGGKELSTTMNQEESVARGCALMAAILSPLYKVREFKVEDSSPFAVNVGWLATAADGQEVRDEDVDATVATMAGAGEAQEGDYKVATLFPANSPTNVLKMLTFYRRSAFDVRAEFADERLLLPGTHKELGTFRIELPPQAEAKKVKVRAKLNLHGMFALEGAQLMEEEDYEEVLKEKRELPPEPDVPQSEDAEPAAAADVAEGAASPSAEGDGPSGEAPKAEATTEGSDGRPAEEPGAVQKDPRFEWVDVVKHKKRAKRTDLTITATGRLGLPRDVLQRCADEEAAMQAEMREIVETDERRNDLEAYVLSMREKVAETGELGAFVSAAERERFLGGLAQAEDWLYDTPDATKAQLVEKLATIRVFGDQAAQRQREEAARIEQATAMAVAIATHRAAAENPGEQYGHIAPDSLAKIAAACADAERWLEEQQARQVAVPRHEPPVLLVADIERRCRELADLAKEVLSEPMPAPAAPKCGQEAPRPGEKSPEAAGSTQAASSPRHESSPEVSPREPAEEVGGQRAEAK